jgi:hypothetical protein
MGTGGGHVRAPLRFPPQRKSSFLQYVLDVADVIGGEGGIGEGEFVQVAQDDAGVYGVEVVGVEGGPEWGGVNGNDGVAEPGDRAYLVDGQAVFGGSRG